MNELSLFNQNVTEKLVTTKELAEVLFIGESTVKRAVQKLGSVLGGVKKNNQGGYLFTEQQATMIKSEIQKHHNLANRQIDNVETEVEVMNNFLEATKKMIALRDSKINELKRLNEEQQKQLEEQAPKVEFFDTVTKSDDTFDMSEVAKILNLGIGRNKLYEILRSKNILRANNEPYQQFVNAGYFKIVESTYVDLKGATHIGNKTVVYQKGLDYIRKIIAK